MIYLTYKPLWGALDDREKESVINILNHCINKPYSDAFKEIKSFYHSCCSARRMFIDFLLFTKLGIRIDDFDISEQWFIDRGIDSACYVRVVDNYGGQQ